MRTLLGSCLALWLPLGCALSAVDGGDPQLADGGPDGGGDEAPMETGPLAKTRLEGLALRFGPILYMHPGDAYLPSSAEWFLQRAGLYKDGRQIQAMPSPVGLPKSGDGFYLAAPDTTRPGDLQSALAYVHGKLSDGGKSTDLQFWFFYPYNGPGTLALKTLIASFDIDLSPFGTHTGDWEHVTLRIDNATETLKAVYLSQHGGGEWITDLSKLELEGRRPAIYSSKNGHAAYRAPGANLSETGSQIGLDYGLRNDTARGTRLDCAVRYRVVADDEPILSFSGRWGPRVDNAPYVNDVLGKVPLVGKAIAETTLAKEAISNGPASPVSQSSWFGDE